MTQTEEKQLVQCDWSEYISGVQESKLKSYVRGTFTEKQGVCSVSNLVTCKDFTQRMNTASNTVISR